MDYETWERGVPNDIQDDPIWLLRVYRSALYAGSLACEDAVVLLENPAMHQLVPQLVLAVGSIASNIDEGYSRASARDRTRFYEYALGSARESRSWYFQASRCLDAATTATRYATLTSLIRMLTTLITRTRPKRPPR